MRRKKQAPKAPVWLTQMAGKVPPAELAEQELLLEGLKQGELTFVGKYRGLGPSYPLALDYALAHEAVFSRRRQTEIFRLWRNKCRVVSLAGKKGARTTRLQAAKSCSDAFFKHEEEFLKVERGAWSVNQLATVLKEKRGVQKSVSTLRRHIRKRMILKEKNTGLFKGRIRRASRTSS